jgi:hypothetical protein
MDTSAMVDTGATGIGFVDATFARQQGLKRRRLKRYIDLFGYNDSRTPAGRVTHVIPLTLNYQGHREKIELYETDLGKHPIILGQPWMERHRMIPNWDHQILTCTAPDCKGRPACCKTQEKIEPLEKPRTRRPAYQSKLPLRHEDWKQFQRRLDMDTDTDSSSDVGPGDPTSPNLGQPDPDPEEPYEKLDICHIGAVPLLRMARRADHEIFSVTLEEIEKALEDKTYTDPKTKLPSFYHHRLPVFSRKEANKLPEHRPYDHQIRTEGGKQHGFGPLYGMSLNELKVLRKYLNENLDKGFIRASTSPVSSPVIFVKKPGGGLRFCVDYRKLNEITIKNRYPIPLIQETLNRLSKAKYYTKLDIISAFNRLRIAKGDEWLTAFRTRYGLFEYLVTPFGLANAPSSFQHYVNDVLRPYLDIFCTAYIDDILIYSEDLDEHKRHVDLILGALQDAGLQLDIDKCEFHKTEVTYLGLIITTNGVKMDPKKVEAIVNWEAPKQVRDIRAFIGFANFYRRFIDNFSGLVAPLIRLTRKDVNFRFDNECQHSFDTLKTAFTTAPILQHFDPELQCIVEADSSDYATGGVLSQYDAQGVLRPVAYFSKRLAPAECNYEIYDKELLAIIRCFEQWRPELEGAAFPIKVLSDHKNLQYFCTTKQLTHRQARWSEYLTRFRFQIAYRPGKDGQKPDALTRRSQDEPAQVDARLMRERTLLSPELFVNLMETNRSIEQIISDEYPEDSFIQEAMTLIREGTRKSRLITLSECEIRDDRLYYQTRLVVPDHDELKIKLLRYVHDSPVGGHNGRTKTLELLTRQYYWPRMYDTVRKYVASCHTCHRSKTSREAYNGLLKPLPVPERRWKHISVDFIVELPSSEENTNMMVVVDRLTKQVHIIPCSKITALAVARLFLTHVWKLHGLPDTIVSDRGTQFVSAFWDELTKRLNIQSRLSTAFHPESDGQTERFNSMIEQYLRAFVSYLQDDWAAWAPMAEFTMNNTASETTKVTPFLANSGQHPRMGFETPTGIVRPAYQRSQVAEVDRFVTRMEEVTTLLHDEMAWAQAIYAEKANRSRIPAPAYQVDDMVWLDIRNMKTRRLSKKLDWKNSGPYRVIEIVSPYAYKLELPNEMKIHPVFHTSLLRPALPIDHALPGQIIPPPPPVEVVGEKEYFVERIQDSRLNRRKRQVEYLVKWVGYDEPSWEPASDLKDTQAAEEFETHHPDKPKAT